MAERRWAALAMGALAVVVLPQTVGAQESKWTSQLGTKGFDAIYALDDHNGDPYGAGEVGGALPDQTWEGSCDAVVRSYHGSGGIRWTRQFGTAGCDIAEGIAVGGDDLYVGGFVEGPLPGQVHLGESDAYVRKYHEDGGELWTRQFGGASFDRVAGAAANADFVYVAGQVFGALPGQPASSTFDGFVRKYDSSGNEVWTRQFGAAGSVMANEVDITADGGVVVVGRAAGALPGQPHAGLRDVFVRRYDPSGNEVWTRQFGTAGNDIAWGVDVVAEDVYVSGDVGGALPGHTFAGGPLDAFVRKYDANGAVIWTHQFGTAGFDRAIRVAADETRVVVVGRVGGALPGQTFAGGDTDPFVRRYDSSGTEDWTIQFGSKREPEAATGVALVDEDDDFFVSGGVGGALSGQKSAGGIDGFVMQLADQSG